MLFPAHFSSCYIMDNDNLSEMYSQLQNGNIFKYKSSIIPNSIPLFSFKARVYVNSNSEYYWMTNDERRSFIRKAQKIINK